MGIPIRLLVWHRRGWFSPLWLAHLPRLTKWLGSAVLLVLALAVAVAFFTAPESAPPTRGEAFAEGMARWLVNHPAPTWTLAGGLTLAALYLLWAMADARARHDLLALFPAGRQRGLQTAADLRVEDVLPQRSRITPAVTFLSRTVRLHERPGASERDSFEVINLSMQVDVALVGPPGMGKSRLAYELVKRMAPETIVIVPAKEFPLGDETDLHNRLRYLRRRRVALVLDDLNLFGDRHSEVVRLKEAICETSKVCSTVATVATDSVPQVMRDDRPVLRDFFSSLRRFELLRMSESQIRRLAEEHGIALSAHDYRGNPGMLLTNFRRLWEEHDKLDKADKDILQAIGTLVHLGIGVQKLDLVEAAAYRLTGATLQANVYRSRLGHLQELAILRQVEPDVIPEELFVQVLVSADMAWARYPDVIDLLDERGDTASLFGVGVAAHFAGRRQAAIDALARVALRGRLIGTPDSLLKSARALSNIGVELREDQRAFELVEEAYSNAAQAGRDAGTPDGLVATAFALGNLGGALREEQRPFQQVEQAVLDAAQAGRDAGTPEGLVATARALLILGVALRDQQRPSEQAHRDAAQAGRDAGTPDGLVAAAMALFKLALDLREDHRPFEQVEKAYRDAAQAGRDAGTPDGLIETAKALANLGIDLGDEHRPFEQTEQAYRDAAQAGRDVGTPDGLAVTARALAYLAIDLSEVHSPFEQTERAYMDAAQAGRDAGTPEGLVTTAGALTNLGVNLSEEQRPFEQTERAYRDAAQAGRDAGTPDGLATTAGALANLGIALREQQRPFYEVERAFQDAAQAGRDTDTPEGHAATVKALVNLIAISGDGGLTKENVSDLCAAAAEAARAAADEQLAKEVEAVCGGEDSAPEAEL